MKNIDCLMKEWRKMGKKYILMKIFSNENFAFVLFIFLSDFFYIEKQ
jgi:hypothetical protein